MVARETRELLQKLYAAQTLPQLPGFSAGEEPQDIPNHAAEQQQVDFNEDDMLDSDSHHEMDCDFSLEPLRRKDGG